MTVEEISLLVGLIATGVSLLGSIIKIIKDIKENSLKKLIEKLMVEAEKQNLTGDEKKNYVVNGVKEYAKKYAILGKDLFTKVSNYIEECIDFSKNINAKGGK